MLLRFQCIVNSSSKSLGSLLRLQWRRTTKMRVITVRRMKELKITDAVDITRFRLAILSKMGAMWFRASLVGGIFPLFGSLGILTNWFVPFSFSLFPWLKIYAFDFWCLIIKLSVFGLWRGVTVCDWELWPKCMLWYGFFFSILKIIDF